MHLPVVDAEPCFRSLDESDCHCGFEELSRFALPVGGEFEVFLGSIFVGSARAVLGGETPKPDEGDNTVSPETPFE